MRIQRKFDGRRCARTCIQARQQGTVDIRKVIPMSATGLTANDKRTAHQRDFPRIELADEWRDGRFGIGCRDQRHRPGQGAICVTRAVHRVQHCKEGRLAGTLNPSTELIRRECVSSGSCHEALLQAQHRFLDIGPTQAPRDARQRRGRSKSLNLSVRLLDRQANTLVLLTAMGQLFCLRGCELPKVGRLRRRKQNEQAGDVR